MNMANFSIFIGIAVLIGTMLILNKLKKDKEKSKVKDTLFLVGIGIAMILFIIGLFTK
ncbi:hypothetical protein KKC88_02850 [Patescibacteria group bacterium]|nr:hypothetical protein [Patescibacteria group bacterium]MBU1673810.1 hypothetical protein [Patescibacteria group bacterium]MBU1964057.1 hypothetical protein [Patescibacteria group bacterium]